MYASNASNAHAIDSFRVLCHSVSLGFIRGSLLLLWLDQTVSLKRKFAEPKKWPVCVDWAVLYAVSCVAA